MSEVIHQETVVFALSVVLGVGLAFFYDFLRILRRMIRHGLLVTGVEDVLFWFLSACSLFVLMFYGTSGALRGYVPAGAGLGALLYLQTASPWLIRVGTGAARHLKRNRKKSVSVLKSKRKKGTIKKKP